MERFLICHWLSGQAQGFNPQGHGFISHPVTSMHVLVNPNPYWTQSLWGGVAQYDGSLGSLLIEFFFLEIFLIQVQNLYESMLSLHWYIGWQSLS
jgi:hypothetical protein